jgi:Icc-related predicted phosphoesterase
MWGRSAAAIEDFNNWLAELQFKYRIVVPGNHDAYLQGEPAHRRRLSNAIVLINEGIEVMGLKVWGSPVTPLSTGAFAISSAADRSKLYDQIPSDIDILVTHTPPFGILDCAPGTRIHAGCAQLLEAVMRRPVKLHVFGHVHNPGMVERNNTLFVNAAMLQPDGDIRETPTILRIRGS